MRLDEYHDIYTKFITGKQVNLYYEGKPCYVKVMIVESNLDGGINFRIGLENEDRSVETGHVSWRTIYEDVSWHPSNSVDFIMES